MGKNTKVNKIQSLSLSIIIVIVLSISCVSCHTNQGYFEPEDLYIICGIGFDKSDDIIRVALQTVENGKLKVYTGCGENCYLAFSNIFGMEARRRDYSHCAIIFFGEEISIQDQNEILLYCITNTDIPKTAKVLYCHESLEMLSIENQSGYDFMSSARNRRDGIGIFLNCGLYDNFFVRHSNKESFYLPYFITKNKEVSAWGLKVWTKNGQDFILDKTESIFYLMCMQDFKFGNIEIIHDNKIYFLNVTKSKTNIDVKNIDENLTIDVKVKVRSNEKSKDYSMISEIGENFIYDIYMRYGDIFGFENFINIENISSIKNIKIKFEIVSK